jgi:hypothetical protein
MNYLIKKFIADMHAKRTRMYAFLEEGPKIVGKIDKWW